VVLHHEGVGIASNSQPPPPKTNLQPAYTTILIANYVENIRGYLPEAARYQAKNPL
jgi:hypothetical protein